MMSDSKACPFHWAHAKTYAWIRCSHYHSGLQQIEFSERVNMKKWLSDYCYYEHTACPYYKINVGQDTTYEDKYILIITFLQKEYWMVVNEERDIRSAIFKIINKVLPVQYDQACNLKINVVHTSEPTSKEIIDDLIFSGVKIE